MKTLLNLESSQFLQVQTPRTTLLLPDHRKHRNPIRNKSRSGSRHSHHYPELLIIQPIRSLSRKMQQLEAINKKGFINRAQTEQKTEELERRTHKNGDDDGDKIPEVVWERMIRRMLLYVGVPLLTGFVMMQIFSVVKEKNLWDFPIWLPFLTIFVTFGASTVGIVYGTLSTSWDAERKGSALGLEEFQKNWVDMWKEE